LEVDKDTKWIHCNSCNRSTEHVLVSEYSRNKDQNIGEDYNPFIITETFSWFVWECNGCKVLTGESSYSFSEDYDWLGNPVEDINFYPERKKEYHPVKQFNEIPEKLEGLYNEVVLAYNNSCGILAAIGLRSLLEGICVDKGVTADNIQKKIDKMNFIPDSIRNNLHAFRFLGNDAAHELIIPDKKDLQMAIFVIEDILNIVYDLDYKSKLIFDKFNRKA